MKLRFLLALPLFSSVAFAQTPVNSISGLLGGGVGYSERRTSDQSIRAYSMPVFLPLEATLGRFYLTGSLEYAKREMEGTTAAQSEGLNYVNMEGRFRAIETENLRLTFSEIAGISTARDSSTLPPQSRLPDGYRLDSGLSLLYKMERLSFEMSGGHSTSRTRGDFRPGDTYSAGLMLGFGFGGYRQDSAPISLMMGVTSRYYGADRLGGDEMPGTEYGTVFFSPGLMLSGKSLALRAGLDFPIRHLGADDTYRDRMRANIGLRYYLQ